ncbi:MAG: molybdopterin-dependent oxidoreductase [Chloroflexi bacterium]|nr:molybdopterin-dependent oxidoreductase [Chloroflexota bacterium]
MNSKPGWGWGALIGGVLSIPLIAISYLGFQAAALPFVPFDLFDWLARNLPTPLLTIGRSTIEEVVAAVQIGNSSDTAKTAENLMGILIVVAIGAIAGLFFFLLMNRLRATSTGAVPGLVLGVLAALPFLLFTLSVNLSAAADPLMAVIWIGALFAIWGLGVGWAYQRLSAPLPVPVRSSAAQPTTNAYAIDRRSFLVQVGAATATITVIGAGLGSLLSRRIAEEQSVAQLQAASVDSVGPEVTAEPLPNAADPVVPAPGTRSEITPLAEHYRIDIRSDPNGLDIPEEGYTLQFESAIPGEEGPIAEMTLDDIRNNFEPVSDYITMSCISNRVAGDLISTIKWTGARMKDVLATVEVPERATHLRIWGGDDFDETVALDVIENDERVMLCYAWEDKPLTSRHGFPLRIHIPNLYGMKQPKWITRIEFLEGDQDGYWVRRGWDKVASVMSTSVIDTVATENAFANAEGSTLIPIGGIAWAGDRGIAKVEVRIDGGDWVGAQIRSAVSDRTWNLWRYDWPFVEGDHTFEVRCVEGDGAMQMEAVAGTRPSGATGLHSVRTTVSGTFTLTPRPPLL